MNPSPQQRPLSPATPDEAFFLALLGVYTQLQKRSEATLRREGLTVAEYGLLRVVENMPGITAAFVRKRLFASAPFIAQLVASAETKGFLSRARDLDDGRRQPLILTSLGKKTARAARGAVEEMLRSLRLPEALLRSLASDLTTVLHSLPPHGAARSQSLS